MTEPITPQHGLTCIDVFCGCGGFSCGMMQAGFEVLAGIDNNAIAIATYRTNLGDEATKIIGDIPKKDRKWFDKPDGWRRRHSMILESVVADRHNVEMRVSQSRKFQSRNGLIRRLHSPDGITF